MNKYIVFFFFLLSFFIFSCSMNKNLTVYPKSIYLKIFNNNTYQYSLHTTFNDFLKDELLTETNINFVDENLADYIISGEIFNYELKPMSYDMNNNVESYEEVIEIRLRIKDRALEKVILEENFSDNEIYFTMYGNSYETKSNTTLEKEAQDKILKFIARSISRKIIYTDFKNLDKAGNESNNDNVSETMQFAKSEKSKTKSM